MTGTETEHLKWACHRLKEYYLLLLCVLVTRVVMGKVFTLEVLKIVFVGLKLWLGFPLWDRAQMESADIVFLLTLGPEVLERLLLYKRTVRLRVYT